jgi:hypothetical protein
LIVVAVEIGNAAGVGSGGGSGSSALPKFNSETTDVAEIYLSRDLMPVEARSIVSGLLEQAKKKAKKLATVEEHASAEWQRVIAKDGEFIARKLAALGKLGDVELTQKSNEGVLKLLIYLSFLRRLHHAPQELPGAELFSKKYAFVPALADAVLPLFAEPRTLAAGELDRNPNAVQYNRPKYLRDRLINYICILMLKCNDYEIALDDVQRELSLETQK